METIRRCTFETNSSSCHSVTTMPARIWEKFKNQEVFFNRTFWEIECHESKANIIDEDAVLTLDELYDIFIKTLDENKNEIIRKYNSDSYYKYESYVFKWICSNVSKENFMKWRKDFDKEFDDINPPIVIDYPWSSNGEPCVHDKVTGYWVNEIINNIFNYSELETFPYYYTDGNGWETATVYGSEPKTFDIKIPGHYVKDDIKISDDTVSFDIINCDTIRISLKGDAKVIVERDEEC